MRETKLTPSRLWVLRHWQRGGGSIVPDRLSSKRAERDILQLIKGGYLEISESSDIGFISNGLFRITEAGLLVVANQP